MAKTDYVGHVFGMLTVVEELPPVGHNRVFKCLCACGRESVTRYSAMSSGHTKSCGCQKSRGKRDLTGERFGRLLVLEEIPTGSHNRRFRCLCDCGNESQPWYPALTTGAAISCGCYNSESKRTHGLENHPLYPTWRNMISRCTNPKDARWARYGGRGIKVDPAWENDFAQFLQDMGDRPTGTSIDRIDNDGNYEPVNCRWATTTEQQHNKSSNVKVAGVVMADWARALGVTQSAINSRVTRHGETHEEAIVHFATKGGYL